jgi:hypothetical protein
MKTIRIKIATVRRIAGGVRRPGQPGKKPTVRRLPREREDDDD